MNTEYILMTDTNCDLPLDYLRENGIGMIPMNAIIDGVTYLGDEEVLTGKEFYDKMRAGASPTTTQMNLETAKERFTRVLEQGKDILHVSFSSALSGSYNVARIAAEELGELYPDRKLLVVDSLCASLGQGLLLYHLNQLKQQGMGLEELYDYAQNTKMHICHNFTVDDLKYLYRGGRVSKTTAIFGTALGIKPIMHVDNEGRLVPCGKVRGRKASLNALVENMVRECEGCDNDIFFISHGDCEDDALLVKKLVQEKTGIQNCLIHHVGPSIGSHSGPGTVALFAIGKARE